MSINHDAQYQNGNWVRVSGVNVPGPAYIYYCYVDIDVATEAEIIKALGLSEESVTSVKKCEEPILFLKENCLLSDKIDRPL